LTPEELAKALWETWTGNEPDPAWTWERDVDEAHRDDFRAQAARLLACPLFEADRLTLSEPPVFDLNVVLSPERAAGDPLPSVDGRLWTRVVFGGRGVACGWDATGVFHLWAGPEEVAECVFRAQRERSDVAVRASDRRALAAARLEGLLSYLDDRGGVDRAHVARVVTAALHALREGP
jgi:hypothetical protein